jgi:hypothetical protein
MEPGASRPALLAAIMPTMGVKLMSTNKHKRAQLRRCLESAVYNLRYRGSEALHDVESDLEFGLELVRKLLDEEMPARGSV